ncbi:Uncharacterised protein [Escherichia coli]|nr:Uncharacterised protein [Escherichia coli]
MRLEASLKHFNFQGSAQDSSNAAAPAAQIQQQTN